MIVAWDCRSLHFRLRVGLPFGAPVSGVGFQHADLPGSRRERLTVEGDLGIDPGHRDNRYGPVVYPRWYPSRDAVRF